MDSFAQASMSRNRCISDETLLGYLLLALPDEEQWRIECLENSNPELRQRIQDLRDLLQPMKATSQPSEPSGNLTAATMAFIEQSTHGSNQLAGRSDPQMSQPIFESNRSTRLAWIDSLVTLAAGIVVLSILIPSVWSSRESARRISCASNLRELGHALSLFAYGNADHRLPGIDKSGPLSFAGVYTIRLKHAGLLETPSWIWCSTVGGIDLSEEIPTVYTYLAGTPRQQQSWKYAAVGNYSYNLGNMVDGEYATPCINGRSHFAVLGDSLMSNNLNEDVGAVHGANLANILYEDGRIQSVLLHPRNSANMLDNPYLNRDMQQAVGRDLHDTCLGPSFQNPFKPVVLE